MEANKGKFRLRDLLSVPMQRVLKYHLLLKVSYIRFPPSSHKHLTHWLVSLFILCCQELIKQTDKNHPDRKSLERALDEMQDLSLYVNEVKRDNEALQLINEIQNRYLMLLIFMLYQTAFLILKTHNQQLVILPE